MKAHLIGGIAHGEIVDIDRPYPEIIVPKLPPMAVREPKPLDILSRVQLERYYRTTNILPEAEIYEYRTRDRWLGDWPGGSNE